MQYSSRAADRESEVFGKLFGIAELHIYLLYYMQILYIIAYNIAIIYCKKMDMSIHICKKQKNAGGQPAFFVCRFLKLRQENGFFGRSDRTRTCSILLPKQARYQLRYTSKYLVYKMS